MPLVLGRLLAHFVDHLAEDRLLRREPLLEACLGRGGGLAFQGQAYPVVLEHFVGRVQKIEDLRHADVGDRLIQNLFDLDRRQTDV